jgi:co-chaperonin GroES (HSP10)
MRFMPLQVEKGDFVLYVLNSAFEIHLEGSKYFVVPNGSILAILRNTLDIEGAER